MLKTGRKIFFQRLHTADMRRQQPFLSMTPRRITVDGISATRSPSACFLILVFQTTEFPCLEIDTQRRLLMWISQALRSYPQVSELLPLSASSRYPSTRRTKTSPPSPHRHRSFTS